MEMAASSICAKLDWALDDAVRRIKDKKRARAFFMDAGYYTKFRKRSTFCCSCLVKVSARIMSPLRGFLSVIGCPAIIMSPPSGFLKL